MTPRAIRTIAQPTVAALFPILLACGPMTPTSASPSHDAAIAALHAAKCGACHSPPEPETRSRAHLEAAFKRHKNRVRLTPAQWGEMTDYLAAPPGATAWQVR